MVKTPPPHWNWVPEPQRCVESTMYNGSHHAEVIQRRHSLILKFLPHLPQPLLSPGFWEGLTRLHEPGGSATSGPSPAVPASYC